MGVEFKKDFVGLGVLVDEINLGTEEDSIIRTPDIVKEFCVSNTSMPFSSTLAQR